MRQPKTNKVICATRHAHSVYLLVEFFFSVVCITRYKKEQDYVARNMSWFGKPKLTIDIEKLRKILPGDFTNDDPRMADDARIAEAKNAVVMMSPNQLLDYALTVTSDVDLGQRKQLSDQITKAGDAGAVLELVRTKLLSDAHGAVARAVERFEAFRVRQTFHKNFTSDAERVQTTLESTGFLLSRALLLADQLYFDLVAARSQRLKRFK